jgi:hypothetical protein
MGCPAHFHVWMPEFEASGEERPLDKKDIRTISTALIPEFEVIEV